MDDGMRVPCPVCKAEVDKACHAAHGAEMLGSIHFHRKELAKQMAAKLKDLIGDEENPLANPGFNMGLKLSAILTRIATRGREGSHDEDDKSCGCGRCCSMLTKGLIAHMEGVMATGDARWQP